MRCCNKRRHYNGRVLTLYTIVLNIRLKFFKAFYTYNSQKKQIINQIYLSFSNITLLSLRFNQ